jgi:hypothetical protein
MAKETPKPRGFGPFDKLARMIVKVPKSEIDDAKPAKRKKPKK